MLFPVTPRTPNFEWKSEDQFVDPLTGHVLVCPAFLEGMEKAQQLRSKWGAPLQATSGFRHPLYNVVVALPVEERGPILARARGQRWTAEELRERMIEEFGPEVDMGAEDSQHLLLDTGHPESNRFALDLTPSQQSPRISPRTPLPQQIRILGEMAKQVGFRGIGLYDGHIHVDPRLTPAYWDLRSDQWKEQEREPFA